MSDMNGLTAANVAAGCYMCCNIIQHFLFSSRRSENNTDEVAQVQLEGPVYVMLMPPTYPGLSDSSFPFFFFYDKSAVLARQFYKTVLDYFYYISPLIVKLFEVSTKVSYLSCCFHNRFIKSLCLILPSLIGESNPLIRRPQLVNFLSSSYVTKQLTGS